MRAPLRVEGRDRGAMGPSCQDEEPRLGRRGRGKGARGRGRGRDA